MSKRERKELRRQIRRFKRDPGRLPRLANMLDVNAVLNAVGIPTVRSLNRPKVPTATRRWRKRHYRSLVRG